HALAGFLAELDRAGAAERLELSRFDRGELVAQLTGILGAPPAFEVVEDVLARSEGNPFLAEELLAGGGSTGDILLARLRELSWSAQSVLRAWAAWRGPLSHHVLAELVPSPEAALREALEHHVIVR